MDGTHSIIRVMESLDMNNFILIRGLSTLLRSRILAAHVYFMEESIYIFHVENYC